MTVQIVSSGFLLILTKGQYHLEIIDGKIRWFHRNEKGETVFSAETVQGVIKPKTWYEIGVTYSSEGVSRIFCDGNLMKEEISDKMTLSQDWGAFAGNISKVFRSSSTGMFFY